MITLPSPQEIAPLDPDEFVEAYRYAGMVMENEFFEEVPGIGTALIRTQVGTFGLSKHPINLFGVAVMRHFRLEPDKGHAFLWRFRGLQNLLQQDEMKLYISGPVSEPRIHSAVLEVVATHKLSDRYNFEPKSFFQRVREVAARIDRERA